jgi:hypothetical protein
VTVIQKDPTLTIPDGTVEVVVGGSEKTDCRDDTTLAAFNQNDLLNGAVIEWLTGSNAGIKSGVTDYAVSAAERLVVVESTPYNIVVGDTYNLVSSDVKSISTDTGGGDLKIRNSIYDTNTKEGIFSDYDSALKGIKGGRYN